MSLFRRLTAIIVQCAVMIMPLVDSGVRCDDSAGHGAHMDMADMSMPGMPMPGDDDGNGSGDSHPDCSFPWSSGECRSMTSCAPTAMSVEQPSVAGVAAQAHDAPMLPARDLRSVTRAPEPPPPRA